MLPFRDDIPRRGLPALTLGLIALNLVASLAAGSDAARLGAVPDEVADRPGTLLSALFVNAGWAALALNALFLWLFGATLEDSMGRVRFAAFYLLGGGAALGLQLALEPDSGVALAGAGGAVAAVVAGYAVLHPRARVVTLVALPVVATIITVPALVWAGIWLGGQVMLGAAGLSQPEGAAAALTWAGLAGGLAFGAALGRPFAGRFRDDRAARGAPAH